MQAKKEERQKISRNRIDVNNLKSIKLGANHLKISNRVLLFSLTIKKSGEIVPYL